MRILFHICRWDLIRLLKDRQLAFWTLVGPILFMLVFGYLTSGSPSQKDPSVIQVSIQNLPKNHPLRKFLAQAGIQDNPHGKSALKFAPDNPLDVTINIAEEGTQWQVQSKIWRAFADFLTHSSDAGKPKFQVITRPWSIRNPLPTGFAYSIPAYLVMYIFFNMFGTLQGDWIEDRHSEFFRRILGSSVSYRMYYAAKIIARTFLGFLSVIIAMIMAQIYDVEWGNGIETVGIILSFYIIGCVSLGFLVSHLFHQPEAGTGMGIFIGLIMAALGGCWWPLEIVSPTMQKVGHLLPTGQMMDAFMKSFLYPKPMFGTNLLYMTIFALGSLLLTFLFINAAFRRIQEGN